MTTRALFVLVTFCFSASAFAQNPPPKTAKPQAQAKPQTPMGCKFVGTVKGTKIWAGDCIDAAGLRGAAPAAETAASSLAEQKRQARFHLVKNNNFTATFARSRNGFAAEEIEDCDASDTCSYKENRRLSELVESGRTPEQMANAMHRTKIYRRRNQRRHQPGFILKLSWRRISP